MREICTICLNQRFWRGWGGKSLLFTLTGGFGGGGEIDLWYLFTLTGGFSGGGEGDLYYLFTLTCGFGGGGERDLYYLFTLTGGLGGGGNEDIFAGAGIEICTICLP